MKYVANIFSIALFMLIITLFSVDCYAGAISVHGPSQVSVGEQFYLKYTVNTTDVTGFRLGNVPNALEVLIGPNTSTQQSFSMVNGNMTHTASVTYTYVLLAREKGTFVIPSARANVDGKNAASQALRINVVGKASTGSQHQQGHNNARMDRAGAPIRGNDLFIKVTANIKHHNACV